ncbi:MAG TPA: VOC family protein [Cyclobacteriaceae bacterium]|nr:VOC family protein [Cyclobacteriaceae bacterium]
MKRSLFILFSVLLTSAAFGQAPKASINHVGIFVMDCKKSAAFYHDIIGLDTIPEPFHDGKHVWMRIGPKQAIHIIEGSKAPKEYYKNNHICFTVASVDDFAAVLKKNNIEYEDVTGKKGSITSRPDKVKQIWLRDPDGYWLEINDAKD